MDCTICMEPLTDKQQTTVSCGHKFHKVCFDDYVKSVGVNKVVCPLCRKVLSKPTLTYEQIDKIISDYNEDWDGNLDCNDLIDGLKIDSKYDNIFTMDYDAIRKQCEEYKGGKRRLTKRKINVLVNIGSLI